MYIGGRGVLFTLTDNKIVHLLHTMLVSYELIDLGNRVLTQLLEAPRETPYGLELSGQISATKIQAQGPHE